MTPYFATNITPPTKRMVITAGLSFSLIPVQEKNGFLLGPAVFRWLHTPDFCFFFFFLPFFLELHVEDRAYASTPLMTEWGGNLLVSLLGNRGRKQDKER
jgi:hypothetical protein